MGPPVDGPADRDLRPARAYALPDALRPRFAEPWGPVHATGDLPDLLAGVGVVVAVGDVVSLTLKRLGVTPRVAVVDYKTQRGDDSDEFRQELGSWGERELRVHNPAGQLTREAWTAVRRAMLLETGLPTRVVVEGEEDLVGLACFLEAPPGARVLYGIPGRGVCVVEVTAALKQSLAELVQDLPAL